MNSENYISKTLQLPPEIPLFKYKVDFGGLKNLLEELNVQTNTNSDSIKRITDDLKTKYNVEEFKGHEKILNNSIKFGLNVQKYIDNDQNKFMQIKINPKEQKSNTEEFAYKVSKVNQIVDYLLLKVTQNEERTNTDDKKHEGMINESFKRLEDKIESSLSSFSKTINNYFNETNKKSSNIQSEFHMLQSSQNNKLKQMQDQLSAKVSSAALDSSLQSFKHKILVEMDAQISADQMRRMAAIEEFKTQLQQLQKNMDLQNKLTKQKVSELQQKVKVAMPTKIFEMQKHKIYQKLSEFKNKTDELSRKNGQFVEFRKSYLIEKQKMKQQIIGFEEQIKKLNTKESSFKKMENVSDILEKLDPHLICEIGNQVKLHQKQIGKLEKKLMDLENKGGKNNKETTSQTPQLNNGENSEMIQKIIKEYMSNMDFQGRIKKVQKDLFQTSRRADSFYDLEKKIYNLSKEMDVGAIMKELKRKCDEQSTRKELKIVDTKIESLFEYFKTIRKQLEVIYKRTSMSSTKESPENPSLTSKKLLGANCISCTPNSSKRRVFSRQKLDFSLDESHDYLKASNYQRFK